MGADMLTKVSIHHGDVFDVQADCLICSANVFLTLSGGVGGELLRRYGDEAQQPLDAFLQQQGIRYVSRGAVVETRPANVPYRMVIHAVAVDGMYDSTSGVITQVVREALARAVEAGCRSVVMPALATGYGHLSFEMFMAGWLEALPCGDFGLETVTLALRDEEHARTALAGIADRESDRHR